MMGGLSIRQLRLKIQANPSDHEISSPFSVERDFGIVKFSSFHTVCLATQPKPVRLAICGFTLLWIQLLSEAGFWISSPTSKCRRRVHLPQRRRNRCHRRLYFL